MHRADAAPSTGTDDERIRAEIHTWVWSTPLRGLVAHFGGTWPDGDLTDVLRFLDDFSAATGTSGAAGNGPTPGSPTSTRPPRHWCSMPPPRSG